MPDRSSTQETGRRATGKTLKLLDALLAHPDGMTWDQMRDVIGTNRGLCSVYDRARSAGWIVYVGEARPVRYGLTTAGAKEAARA
jgi:hypothetical protein